MAENVTPHAAVDVSSLPLGPAQAAAAEPMSVVAVFAAMAESITERGALDKEIIEGMGVLAKAVTGLRKLTLKTRAELHRLRKDWLAGQEPE